MSGLGSGHIQNVKAALGQQHPCSRTRFRGSGQAPRAPHAAALPVKTNQRQGLYQLRLELAFQDLIHSRFSLWFECSVTQYGFILGNGFYGGI